MLLSRGRIFAQNNYQIQQRARLTNYQFLSCQFGKTVLQKASKYYNGFKIYPIYCK